LLHLARLSPALADVVTFSRPSVVYKDGLLVMSLSAFTVAGGNTPDRVVMITSRDHGKSWRYAGVALSTADLPKIGAYSKISGATLTVQDGQVYLLAALGDDAMQGQGTVVFAVDDVASAKVARDAKTGAPAVVQ